MRIGYPQKQNIHKVWVDHNQFENGVKGMRIHVKFTVHNFKGRKGSVFAYFYKKNEDTLKDSNGRYCTTEGQVSVGKNFTPRFVNSTFNDFKLFIPNHELHVRGKHNLKFMVQIFNMDTSTALSGWSDWVHFWYGY